MIINSLKPDGSNALAWHKKYLSKFIPLEMRNIPDGVLIADYCIDGEQCKFTLSDGKVITSKLQSCAP